MGKAPSDKKQSKPQHQNFMLHNKPTCYTQISPRLVQLVCIHLEYTASSVVFGVMFLALAATVFHAALFSAAPKMSGGL